MNSLRNRAIGDPKIPLGLDSVTRGWAIIAAGTAVRLGLNFLTGILLARTLGPASFGLYALLMAAAAITGVIVDLGLTESAVKHMAAAWDVERSQTLLQSRVFFWLRVGLAGLGIVLGILLSPLFSRLLQIPGQETLIVLALLSMGTTVLSGSVNAILQATSRFGRISAVMVSSSGVGVVAVLLLALTGYLTLVTALWMSVWVSVAGLLVGRRLLPAEWFESGKRPLRYPGLDALRQWGRPLLRFGRWLWVANIFKVLVAYLDVFLINRWLPSATVGVYALALNLSTRAEIINHSLYTVLIPTASALKSKKAVRRYLQSGFIRSGLVSLVLLALIPIARWLIPLIYGLAYRSAVDLFTIMLLVVIFDILTLPALLLIYAFDRPKLAAIAGALQCLTLIVVGNWLIPVWGPPGAVLAKFSAKVLGTTVTLVVLARHYVSLHEESLISST